MSKTLWPPSHADASCRAPATDLFIRMIKTSRWGQDPRAPPTARRDRDGMSPVSLAIHPPYRDATIPSSPSPPVRTDGLAVIPGGCVAQCTVRPVRSCGR
ncbi:hypothetical protein AAFF_G00183020 [Aldrovandia affinis]|uniref:Uncharacterized protein n=1 Tax=Aldrovandia affinis TaxID=143900 RepID=A0AAD7RKR6_9TELE|nr:hypothetical protein AAFF_G00183020 [Aldrovandia affinis]